MVKPGEVFYRVVDPASQAPGDAGTAESDAAAPADTDGATGAIERPGAAR